MRPDTTRTAATGDEAVAGLEFTLNRRSVLAAGLAAMGGAAGGGSAGAATQPFFQRHGLPIGLQLYTLGPDAQKDLDGTLAAVSKIGYRAIELAGLLGRTAPEMKAAMDRAGLVCTSAHIQGRAMGSQSFGGDLGKLADDLNVIGVKSAVMPLFYIPDRFELKPNPGEDGPAFLSRLVGQMTVDDWKWNADFLNKKGEALKAAGIAVGYHNHNNEFAPLGDTTPMDILLQETDPSLVTFEMDAGWVTAAGRDPFELLKTHKGRFTLMHVKDIKPTTQANFALKQDPTEVGSGMIDWKKLLPAAYAAGVRQFFVEQEPPFPGARIDSVKVSYDYLAGVTA
ncbi:sugar phosphate isomerase/epimerase family protein [Phenylobacterium sp.]|uniref:sugar phosphate isomerase/epimerase family protein n=1 Tax=Phenylobacterium sp. TaxID=1871053 RepID=UPI0035B2C827